jgi:hypothetical protein
LLDDPVQPLEVRASPVGTPAGSAAFEPAVDEENLQRHGPRRLPPANDLENAIALHAARVRLDAAGQIERANDFRQLF